MFANIKCMEVNSLTKSKELKSKDPFVRVFQSHRFNTFIPNINANISLVHVHVGMHRGLVALLLDIEKV